MFYCLFGGAVEFVREAIFEHDELIFHLLVVFAPLVTIAVDVAVGPTAHAPHEFFRVAARIV